jgi:T5SS/PEP-CTERM-associated repeat protein
VLVDGGAISVTGTNSGIGVGNSGTGTLSIVNGGSVSALNLGIGNATGAVGTVTVGNGSGVSQLTVTNSFGVGNQSTANSQLTVNSGGSVSVGGFGLGIAGSAGSHGTVLVDGGALSVSGGSGIGIGNAAGGTGAMTIRNGGSVLMAGQNTGVSVGGSGSGSLTVNTAGSLTTESLNVASNAGSTGVVNIVGTNSGPQTTVTLNGPANASNGVNPLQVGNWGNGTMTVSNGAIVNGAVGNANCGIAACNNFVGNAAGSTGLLTITDHGTTVSLGGGFIVGGAAVFTNPPNSFTFGTPGGTTNATLQVLNGATLNTRNSSVSTGPGGANPTGGEHTIASVTIDGAGSSWNVTRNPVNGAQAFVNVANAANATATIDVTNGGKIVITGNRPDPLTDSSLPGINLNGGTSTMNVTGAGSALVINGDTGVISVGTNGGHATLNITAGGKVYSDDPNGLMFINVGRTGATGTLNVDGSGSQLTLSGIGGVNTGANNENNAGFMTIGRDGNAVGSAFVTNGGSILLSDGGQNATGGAGINLGREAGSSGSLTVSGLGSHITIEQTGAGSTAASVMNIGRAGSGQLSVTGGATILINDLSQATTGGGSGFNIGRDTGSSGSATVSGIGSSITINQARAGTASPGAVVGGSGTGTLTVTNGATVAVNGPTERDVTVGNAVGGTGTLTVSNGAQLTASWLGVGNNGGHGTATIDNATVLINGVAIDPNNSNSLFGGSIRVGRVTGSVGTLDLVNSAHIVLDTATAGASINLGGTGAGLGGNGTLNMSGGSSITFAGTNATPGASVNIGHSGTGLFTMTGGSTLSMPNDGGIVLGNRVAGNGTLQLGGGSTINTGSLIVGNNGHGTVTMTGGTFGVHGTTGADEFFIVGANNGAVGTFSQAGGAVSVASRVVLGWQTGSSGTYTFSDGTLTSGGVYVGDRGTGAFVMSAAGAASTTNNVAGVLLVAGDTTSNGSSYTITGNNAHTSVNFGAIVPSDPPGLNGIDPNTNQPRPTPNGALAVGVAGTGTFTQGAANFSDPLNTVNVAGDLIVGVFGTAQGAAGQGTYTLNTGTLTVGGKVVIGGQSQGANLFTQNGGSVNVSGAASGNANYVGLGGNDFSGSLLVGGGINDLGGGKGTYHLSGGTVTTGASIVGHTGVGTFNQDGGTHTTGFLLLGNAGGSNANSSGTYNLSGTGVLTVAAGGMTVGGFGRGEFNQSGTSTATIGGTLTVGSGPEQPPGSIPPREGIVTVSGGSLMVSGNMIVGAGNTGTVGGFVGEPGGKGGVTQTGGTVSIAGNLTLGEGSGTGASAGGTGEYVLKGGSLTVTGQTIVGGGGADSTLGGIGRLFVLDGATMNAGTLLGIGSDTGGSNGATGIVILDGGANIYATNIAIGAGGCLGGNGTVHGSVVMSGASIGDCDTGIAPTIASAGNGAGTNAGGEGILKPGRSPGILVIDGAFQYLSGNIQLDVQSDGAGGFVTDQIIFTHGTVLGLTNIVIEYVFLDNTDPNLFAQSNQWVLDTFFKTVDAGGQVEGISDLGVPLDTLFANSSYTATAEDYVITGFEFDPATGVDQATLETTPIASVPEPSTIWLLVLASLLLLRSGAMRRAAVRARRA